MIQSVAIHFFFVNNQVTLKMASALEADDVIMSDENQDTSNALQLDDSPQMQSQDQLGREFDAEDDDFETVEAEKIDDDDEDDDDDFERQDAEIKQAKDRLALNAYDYDGHIQLINLYAQSGDLDELRAARQRMSELFPLTPELWLNWLRDEKEDAQTMDLLYERAIRDYLSIDLWLEYVQHALSWLAQENGIQRIRDVFERALSTVGLHPSKGQFIWDAYRDFEIALYGSSADPAAELQRIYQIFKRQLSIPLLNTTETLQSFQEWVKEVSQLQPELSFDVQSIQATVQKIAPQLLKMQELEDLIDQNPTYENFIIYIDYEKSKKNPARVLLAYERAVLPHWSNSQLWIDYIQYVDKQFDKSFDILGPVYERAVRNVSWDVRIWIRLLRMQEKTGQSDTEVQSWFEKAIATQLSAQTDYALLWIAYLQYKRRRTDFSEAKQVERLRKCFDAAVLHLSKVPDSDLNCSVMKYQALVEAKFVGEIDKCRELWEDIMTNRRDLSSLAENWIEYADLEKRFSTTENYRKVLMRALELVTDNVALISHLLVKFENEEGDSIDTLCQTIHRSDQALKRDLERKKAIAAKQQFLTQSPVESKANVKRKFETNPREDVSVKRVQNMPAKRSAEPPKKDNDGFVIPSSFKESKMPIASSSRPNDDDGTRSLQTVFISNLDFKSTPEKVRKIFEQFGTITDFRFPLNFKGLPKGFCYAEYASIEEARTALKNDRIQIDGRPAFVSEMHKKSDFKYKTHLEKNKLFVSNLDNKVTSDQLKQLFSQYGAVKEARLVTYRNGHSKGIAYVEFVNEKDASTALLKTDNLDLEGRPIRVAISNPSVKQKPDTALGLGQRTASSSIE